MDRILRGAEDWQEAIAAALHAVARPIETDERLLPRDLAGAAVRRSWERADFPPARPAGTLLLVYPAADGALTVPLTVRHAELRAHAGEVSLPGGAVEPGDGSPEAAALREAHEEVGVDPGLVRVLGTLDSIWIPVSNYELTPVVAAAPARPEMRPQTSEVEAIVELPLARLMEADALSDEIIDGPGWQLRAGVYRHEGQRIWGATARTLAMFATVLRRAAA